MSGVFMPYEDKYSSVAIWPDGLPIELTGPGERRFEIETSGHGWNLVRKIRGLAVEHAEGGVIVHGDRSMNDPKEEGYQMSGHISLGGKKRRTFTASQMFRMPNGKLADMAIFYLGGKK